MNPKVRLVKPQSLELHPLAGLVPETPADQYKVLLADVKKRLLIAEPLKVIPGTDTVIDGRTRRKAALDAGLAVVPVVDADLTDTSAVVYMLRAAYLRRNLRPAQAAKLGNEVKKQLAAEMRERIKAGAKKGGEESGKTRRGESAKPVSDGTQGSAKGGEEPGKPVRQPSARDQAAKLAGTSAKAIDAAAKIEAKAPEVYAKMGTGEIGTLAEAKKAAQIDTPKKEPKPPKIGTYLNQVPNFPLAAIAPLADISGVYTIEDLEARVYKVQKERQQKGGSVTKSNALRELGLRDPDVIHKVEAILDARKPTPPLKTAVEIANAVEAAGKLPPLPAGMTGGLIRALTGLDKLDPCPFCGSPDLGLDELCTAPFIVCRRCQACGPCGNTGTHADEGERKEEAISMWNKRAKK